MIKLLRIAEYFGFIIWGINVFDFIALQGIGHIQRIFPSLNSDLVTVSTVVGLLVLILNSWIRYDKHRTYKKIEAEQLRALENKNKADELNNFMFSQALQELPKDEFEQSKNRIK